MDLEELERRQRGVVSRNQALGAGLTTEALRARLRSGRWQRLDSGIYATFTGGISLGARRWAAVLRAGEGAALARRSAAEEVGLAEEERGPVHVMVPDERRVARMPGLIVHRSRHAAERRHPYRLPPQTRVEETVLDLAVAAGSADDAMAWITKACARGLTTPDRIARALGDRARVPGRTELRMLLAGAGAGCGSALEWRYLRDVERRHRLPAGRRQVARRRSGGKWYDDVHYPAEGVRVEIDGQTAHPVEGRRWDLRRDNAAAEAGEVVLRYGTADILDRPCEVARQVSVVLRARGGRRAGVSCGLECAVGHEARGVPPWGI